jgi:hypothetical protein
MHGAALQEIDYDVISVKQMTTKRPTPEGGVSDTPTSAAC